MKQNSKYRRKVDRLPEEMKELLTLVNDECIINDYHAGSMGWHIKFEIKKTNFALIYDRGYLEIVKDYNGEMKSIFPEDAKLQEITVADIANEINKQFA